MNGECGSHAVHLVVDIENVPADLMDALDRALSDLAAVARPPCPSTNGLDGILDWKEDARLRARLQPNRANGALSPCPYEGRLGDLFPTPIGSAVRDSGTPARTEPCPGSQGHT